MDLLGGNCFQLQLNTLVGLRWVFPAERELGGLQEFISERANVHSNQRT